MLGSVGAAVLALALGAGPELRVDWVRTSSLARARCPSADRIEADVRRRLSPEAEGGRIEGWISGSPGDWVAELAIVRADGTRAERRLEDDEATCSRIGAAASLAAALLLDPLAEIGRLVVAPEPEPPPEPEPAPPMGQLDFEAGAVGQAGTLPSISLGARVEGRWRLPSGWSLDALLEVHPEVRTETFGFTLAAGGLGLGYADRVGWLDWGVGLRALVGRLTAVVYPSDVVRASAPGSYLWAGASLELRAAVPIGGPASLVGFGGPVLALTRQRFDVLNQAEPAFQEAPLGARFGLGLVLRFEDSAPR